jgi:hypothetical protein
MIDPSGNFRYASCLSEARTPTGEDAMSKQDAKQDAKQEPQAQDNTQKDPDTWVTGDETMTGAQASYLQTLSEEAGEEFDPSLSKAEASKRIDALREQTGRGIDH